MNKAYKFRLHPNAEQAAMFAKTFGCVRFVYNKMLGEKIEYYNETGAPLKTTPAKYKVEYQFLKEVDSLALANSQMNLDRAYQNFFSNPQTGFPRFKSKRGSKQSYTTNCVNGNIRLTVGHLRLPKVGEVRIKQHRKIPAHYVLKSVTVSRTSTGKYFASLLFEYEQAVVPAEMRRAVGLDFSMKELYVDSEGREPEYNRYYRRSLAKLQRLSRTLSKMEKHGKNWQKQRLKIALLHEKIANQRKDFLHKESRKIANFYDLAGVEDLDMRAMAQALNFGKSVSDNAWGAFRAMLEYKLSEAGKYFVKIDRWFPSSKLCHVCGYKNDALTLADREWACPKCGLRHDRDVNAAINIRDEAVRVFAGA